MRFIADGPSIPDELLLARDQGRVIFFCGAGVSRANAHLPDFFGLAEKVITKLGVMPNSPAFKLIREAQEIDQRVGVSGVISADRVFGLLERDFLSRDIEEAVASALRPPPNCDLRAHNTLLDLATTVEGAVRLVTTNFDRLFDDCGRNLQSWQPPRLPDPLRPNDINGIVYLHGRATPDYTGAEGDGFILSSSEFGRAYLSDGWATSFIRELLESYVVVFVGYTADDPPVQYLLEALRKKSGSLENAYAFQSGDHDDAASRWRHKGVQAIPYSVDNAHAALWLTLEAWAERARNSDLWHSKIIELAKKGPGVLQPHERGQIAHIITTYEGVKKFSQGNNPPPAEWLCVFDPHCRFAKPRRSGSFDEEGHYIDPFDFYGLDSDNAPSKLNPEDVYEKREVPGDAWDAFAFNRLDLTPLGSENLSALNGHWANHSPRLVKRIELLGAWIAAVCNQAASVWWAAHQTSLHSSVQERIDWALERVDHDTPQPILQAWRYLFDTWSQAGTEFHRGRYKLEAVIKNEGWSSSVVRKFGEVCRPYLSAEPNIWGGPKPPVITEDLEIGELIQRDVRYAELHERISVPNEWCAAAIKVLRQNLELAVTLEMDIGGYGLNQLATLYSENNNLDRDYNRTTGISSAVIQFSELYAQLARFDKSAAQQEFGAWPLNEHSVFARLRIWAAGDPDIVPSKELKALFVSLDNSIFWGSDHQRDLLITLSRRWDDLNIAARKAVESKLIAGPDRWEGEELDGFESRRAWSILNRVQWLVSAGCLFSFDLSEIMSDLLKVVPEWRKEYAAKAAESFESQGGWVKTETQHDSLLGIPISSILSRSKELSGRSDDFLIELDPFSGLAASHPLRAFSSLIYAAKQGDFPEWAWQKFLDSDARKKDESKFSALVAKRLLSYPNENIFLFFRSVCSWFRDVSVDLASNNLLAFNRIARKLIGIMHADPELGRSGIIRGNKEADWTMEAINSPVGKIAEAMFNDPRKNNLELRQGVPQSWLDGVESLLSLSDDLRRYALVLMFHNLNWFYAIDPEWTGRNLLPVLDGADADDRDAAWSGFLWGARTPGRELYSRLKSHLLELPSGLRTSKSSYLNVVAGMILSGWGSINEETGERFISDDEMRTVLLINNDHFRSQVLWQAERWSSENDERWSDLLLDLLRVWPRQVAAKSPTISARLCELVFFNVKNFPLKVELSLPLLTKIERDHLVLPELRKEGSDIVERFPAETLAILHSVLPDNALTWPYGIEVILKQIGDSDIKLKSDERLIELNRKWNAR